LGFPSSPRASGPVDRPYGPDQLAEFARQGAIKRERTGGHVLVGSLAMYLLSIPFSLLLIRVVVENAAGVSVSWGEFFDAIQEVGFLWVFVLGIAAQIGFALVAGVGAFYMYRHKASVSAIAILLGIIALAFSVLVFGGIFGIVGGVLSIVGGLRSRPWTKPGVIPPPQYGPPPVGPPPTR